MVVTRGQLGIFKPSYKKTHSVKAPRKKSSPRPKGFKHTMTETGSIKWIKGLRDSLPNISVHDRSVHDNSVDELANSLKQSKLDGGGKSKRRRRRSRRRQYTKKRLNGQRQFKRSR
tara:strand:+ start:3184 stop:3531 length:348 start_codon:yes stop_codon:yes gene_type:complete